MVTTVVVVPLPLSELELMVVVPLPELVMVVEPPSLVIVVELFKPVAETLPLCATAVQLVVAVTDEDELTVEFDPEELFEVVTSCSQGNLSVLRRSWSPLGPFTQVW